MSYEQEAILGHCKENLPAEPFARWLQARYEFHLRQQCRFLGFDERSGTNNIGPSLAVAKEIGWFYTAKVEQSAVRKVHRYRHQIQDCKRVVDGRIIPYTRHAETFPRAVVEEALHFAGVPFSELYPEIAQAEDFPLEPAMTCWTCEDVVTPINGECPWCDSQLRYVLEKAA